MGKPGAKGKMRMSGPGDVAPTLLHCVSSLPPEGAKFPRGGPSEICCPHALALRVGAVPEGASFSMFRSRGFTLIELLLVVAIIAVATAGVGFVLRDSSETQLERDAVRLAALLESARARSQASGVVVVWRSTATGFVFDGLPAGALAEGWLSPDVAAATPTLLVLGPEPITWPQKVQLVTTGPGQSAGTRALEVRSDGVRPYSVQAVVQ
jgi:general secretion pathway protein H